MRLPKTLLSAAATPTLAVLASCLSLASLHAEDAVRPPFKGKLLVDGLVGYQIAAKPLLDNPTSFAIDEKGRIYVVESPRLREGAIIDIRGARQFTLKDFGLQTVEERRDMLLADPTKGQYTKGSERIALLEDTNGDGIPDKRSEYVSEGLGNAEDGLAFSALAYDNQVFLTCIPNLWRFEDRDGDGKAEVREKLLTGFGVGISMMGHDMHGIIRGPDGRLYWSIGDRGFNVVTKEGVRLMAPNRGAIFRSEPDGTQDGGVLQRPAQPAGARLRRVRRPGDLRQHRRLRRHRARGLRHGGRRRGLAQGAPGPAPVPLGLPGQGRDDHQFAVDGGEHVPPRHGRPAAVAAAAGRAVRERPVRHRVRGGRVAARCPARQLPGDQLPRRRGQLQHPVVQADRGRRRLQDARQGSAGGAEGGRRLRRRPRLRWPHLRPGLRRRVERQRPRRHPRRRVAGGPEARVRAGDEDHLRRRFQAAPGPAAPARPRGHARARARPVRAGGAGRREDAAADADRAGRSEREAPRALGPRPAAAPGQGRPPGAVPQDGGLR